MNNIPDSMKSNYNIIAGKNILERYIFKIQASKDRSKYDKVLYYLHEAQKQFYRIDKDIREQHIISSDNEYFKLIDKYELLESKYYQLLKEMNND